MVDLERAVAERGAERRGDSLEGGRPRRSSGSTTLISYGAGRRPGTHGSEPGGSSWCRVISSFVGRIASR